MGGTTFYTYGEGKNPKEAFEQAVKDAKEMYGNRGYTGTIAEKDDFVVIDCPKEMTPSSYANHLIQEDDPRISRNSSPAGCIFIENLRDAEGEEVERTVIKTKTTNIAQNGTKKWATYYVLYAGGIEMDKQKIKKEAVSSAKKIAMLHQTQVDIRIEKRLEEGDTLAATVTPIFSDEKQAWNHYLFFGWAVE